MAVKKKSIPVKKSSELKKKSASSKQVSELKKKSASSKQVSELKKKIKIQEGLITKYKKVLEQANQNLQKITKEFEDSLSLVSNIHRQLIPTQVSKIPQFTFSYKLLPTKKGVSGDFFDIIQLTDPFKFGILLSSCNSYAITSLFLSAVLKSSKKLRDVQSPKDFMVYLADHLHKSFPKQESVHLFFGIVDRRTFQLNYCIAGDIFAAVKTQNSINRLKFSSRILHKDFKTTLKNKKIDLNPKDSLILCSPGVSNAKNETQKPFGSDQILKSIPKNPKGVLEIRQNILFRSSQFGKKESSVQDQTVLVIKVKDRVLRLAKKV